MVPDYYARLGVDPGADAAEIEAALKQQQPVWSMGTRNPKTRHTNQLYLDEVPALRRALLSGPEPRAAYDAELAAVQIAEREQKLDELQRRVRLRAAKGGLTTADRTLLRDEAARLGLDGDVLDRLTRLIPTLTTTTGPADVEELDDDPPADVLDPSTRRQIRGALVALATKDARNSRGMLGKPLLHLRDRPLPFKRMGVEAIVFRPSHRYVVHELLPALPRRSVQIMAAERLQQHFRFVEPRGMRRRLPGAPPVPELLQIVLRRSSRMSGVTIVDQIHPLQTPMPPTEVPQLTNVV